VSPDSFLDNARDLTVKHGLKAASFLFAAGNIYLIARHGFDPENAKLLRPIAAPAILFAANVAGFFNNEKLQNSLGVAGSALMTASFAGADGDDMAFGQTALWAGGVVTGIPGSHLNFRKTEEQKSIKQDGMVQTAVTQGAGNAAFLGLSFLENTPEMLIPYGAWVAASAMKSARAILNAKNRLKNSTTPLIS
jgi:hypothetical protein